MSPGTKLREMATVLIILEMMYKHNILLLVKSLQLWLKNSITKTL
jgi:hypothetical protein